MTPPTPAQQVLAAHMTEAELQTNVIDLAHTYGWLVCHQRPALTTSGYRTAIQGDKGFPDLVLARNGRVLLAELKTATGRLSDDQQRWVREAGVYVWRPRDWYTGAIGRVLGAPLTTLVSPPRPRPDESDVHLPTGGPTP